MNIEVFELERIQSIWENQVDYNLTETGVHPFDLSELLDAGQQRELLSLRLGYGQTNGSIELREAISRLYRCFDLDNVLVTSGSAEANFIAMWRLLEPGDELVLMLPNYMQIWGAARAFGAEVKPFHLREDLGWRPDLEELGRQLTPKTKVIAVCNPNNPTGSVLGSEDMAEIIRLARASGAWLYVDEIYRGAELDGEETPSFAGMYEKTIVAGGLSKAYALPGLRIGWLAGPKPFIADAWSHHDYTTIATGVLSNYAAARALEPGKREKILSRNRAILRGNLDLLQEWVHGQGGRFSLIPPRAGGMAFLRYAMEINSTELSDSLREKKGVFIIAGDCFGMDRFVRIGIGGERDYLRAGLKLIDEGLREIFNVSG